MVESTRGPGSEWSLGLLDSRGIAHDESDLSNSVKNDYLDNGKQNIEPN